MHFNKFYFDRNGRHSVQFRCRFFGNGNYDSLGGRYLHRDGARCKWLYGNGKCFAYAKYDRAYGKFGFRQQFKLHKYDLDAYRNGRYCVQFRRRFFGNGDYERLGGRHLHRDGARRERLHGNGKRFTYAKHDRANGKYHKCE